MRRVVACVVAIAFALMAAGCNLQQDRDFYREGIGSDLNWSGLAQQTQILEQYIAFICEQAGFPTVAANGVVTCDTTNLSPRGWAEFVQAGMNDIDRRCDAYLVWLDDKKRSREPIMKQITETGVAAQAIMRLTGVGVDPITMAGIAFGLAQDTFTNVYSRLLTEIDKSTVQAVVLNEQNDFRRTITGQTINTRSTAIYALRSYLRLCMPYTIETRINTSVTFAQQGGIGDSKLVDATTVGTTMVVAVPVRARQTIGPPNRNPAPPTRAAYKLIIKNYSPATHSISLVDPALAKLCVRKADLESIGPQTVDLVKVYQLAVRHAITGLLTDKELADLNSRNDCPADRLNFFEATMQVPIASKDVVTILNAGLRSINKPEIAVNAPADTIRRSVLPDLRKALASKLNPKLQSDFLSQQITSDLWVVLGNELRNQIFQPLPSQPQQPQQPSQPQQPQQPSQPSQPQPR